MLKCCWLRAPNSITIAFALAALAARSSSDIVRAETFQAIKCRKAWIAGAGQSVCSSTTSRRPVAT